MTTTTVGELSLAEYFALDARERTAVAKVYREVLAGRQHEASSDFDLTPAELADEHAAALRASIRSAAIRRTPLGTGEVSA